MEGLLAYLPSVIGVIVDFAAGVFVDKPNVRKAILIGGQMAKTGLDGFAHLAGIAEKIESLPPGVDFSDADLAEIHEKRDKVVAEFKEMLARRKAEESPDG